jgi:PPOX class probable F420-dependent enzyme
VIDLSDEIRELFLGRNFAHLATTLPDGGPHTVPLWVDLEGRNVVFFTQAGSRKARNLERDPRVALSVTDHRRPYRSAWVRGRVVERRTGEPALEVVDHLARKYTGEPFPIRGANTILLVAEPERAGFVELPFEHRPA